MPSKPTNSRAFPRVRPVPRVWSCLVVAAVLVGTGRSAHAYIDPGTVSIVLQGIVGGIAVAAVWFRERLGRFFARFRRRTDSEDDGSETGPRNVDGDLGNLGDDD